MAIDMDPAATFEIAMGENSKIRTFIFRMVTRRDAKQLSVALGRLGSIGNNTGIDEAEEAMDEITKLVGEQLVGWKNVRDHLRHTIRFDAKQIDRVLSEGDLAELAARLRVASLLGPDEKKVSGSRVRSRRARSAKGARRAAAKI